MVIFRYSSELITGGSSHSELLKKSSLTNLSKSTSLGHCYNLLSAKPIAFLEQNSK